MCLSSLVFTAIASASTRRPAGATSTPDVAAIAPDATASTAASTATRIATSFTRRVFAYCLPLSLALQTNVCIVCMPAAIPPIGTDKQSRIIFVDLEPQLERLRDSGTAFVPQSVFIEKAYNGLFNDEPYIESVTFGKLSCPYLPDTFESSFNDESLNNKSRAGVTFFASEFKPDCALPTAEKAVQFLNFNEQCAQSILPNETVTGELRYEPRCAVVVIAPSSRKELFDQLIEARRPLDEPLRIGVNFVRGLNANPNVYGIDANCHNSKNMYTNYPVSYTHLTLPTKA